MIIIHINHEKFQFKKNRNNYNYVPSGIQTHFSNNEFQNVFPLM